MADFFGCCNPAQLAVLPDGRFVTAEKGIPRVKIYSRERPLSDRRGRSVAVDRHARRPGRRSPRPRAGARRPGGEGSRLREEFQQQGGEEMSHEESPITRRRHDVRRHPLRGPGRHRLAFRLAVLQAIGPGGRRLSESRRHLRRVQPGRRLPPAAGLAARSQPLRRLRPLPDELRARPVGRQGGELLRLVRLLRQVHGLLSHEGRRAGNGRRAPTLPDRGHHPQVHRKAGPTSGTSSTRSTRACASPAASAWSAAG